MDEEIVNNKTVPNIDMSKGCLVDDILNDLANAGVSAAIQAGNQIGNAAIGAVERTLDNLKGQLLLGNVYGANALSNIQFLDWLISN